MNQTGGYTSHVNSINTPISDLTDLPRDVFLLIISHLSPAESVLCRRVSRSWRAAFTDDGISRNLMRWHFPRAREMRHAVDVPDHPPWARVFPEIARRYFYLQSARPRLTEEIDINPRPSPGQNVGWNVLFQAFDPWDRWLQWESDDNVADFQHHDPSWCLDDGLLIYPQHTSRSYVAYDLEMGSRFPVPFDCTGRVIRRVRLAHGVLVIEWRMSEECHGIGDNMFVRHRDRYSATAFDVRRPAESNASPVPGPWEVRLRAEWKLYQVGLPPLCDADHLLSAHTATHYALYVWQDAGLPRPWEDAREQPAEQLTIWEIGNAAGPRVVRTLARHDLDFLGIRQGRTPMIREVLLDDANVYVHEETHRWLEGPHASTPPRNHHVRSTGIPISGAGPRWLDECGAAGDIHLSFCPRAGSAVARPSDNSDDDDEDDDDDTPGRLLVDRKWPGWAPCWRHEEFPYLTVSDVVDVRAGVRFVARHCFLMEVLSSSVPPHISLCAETDEVRFADGVWGRLLAAGKIAGDERWVVGQNEDGCITIMRF